MWRQLNPSCGAWLYRATAGDAQILDVRSCPSNFPCLFQGKVDGLQKVILWHTSGHPFGLQGAFCCVFYQSIYLKHSSPPQTLVLVHSLFADSYTIPVCHQHQNVVIWSSGLQLWQVAVFSAGYVCWVCFYIYFWDVKLPGGSWERKFAVRVIRSKRHLI